MGCCSSTERSSREATSTLQPETAVSPSSPSGPLGSAASYNGTRSNNIYSPTSSRAPLTAPDSTSVLSTPRQSSANRRRSTATQQSNTDGALSSHYNLPLTAPKPWKSTNKMWTPSSVAKERQDFFDTRVTGRREVWEALRQVSECIREEDVSTAQGILTAAGITLPTGRLEDGCYDERGELYRVSHVILRDPENLKRDGEVDHDAAKLDDPQGKELSVEQPLDSAAVTPLSETESLNKGKEAADVDAMAIKCRMSNSGTDTTILLGKALSAGSIFDRLRQQVIKGGSLKMRIFYLGKELHEKEKLTLGDFGWREGHVLNIFVIS